MIFDSHAHYDDDAFDADREQVLEDIKRSGVSYVVNAGASIESSRASIKLAERFDHVYAAVGIHPQDAGTFDEGSIGVLRGLCRNKKVVAVGEIGLDYYYEGQEKDVQKRVFEEQIKLALEQDLPVIVHDREAHLDTFETLKKYEDKGLRGVLHCYSGSPEMAVEYVKMGFYIGFTGVITFKNARKALEVLEKMPLDRVLIETDCPYLAPVPFRGKRNDSRFLEQVINKACEVLNLERDSLIKKTCDNAKRLFNIKQYSLD